MRQERGRHVVAVASATVPAHLDIEPRKMRLEGLLWECPCGPGRCTSRDGSDMWLSAGISPGSLRVRTAGLPPGSVTVALALTGGDPAPAPMPLRAGHASPAPEGRT